nr:coat protein [Beauveria bassiana dsRNA mycovirus 1]
MTTDMRNLFGGAKAKVSFDAIPGLSGHTLPVPERGDTLKRLAAKTTALRRVIESGHSLAVATGMKAAAFNTVDPEEKAIAEMGVVEKEQYMAWRGGARLGDFNRLTSLEPTNKWNGSTSTLDRWVMGLRRMYEDEEIGRENAVWWAVHADFLVPTITAHVKVLNAGRSMVDKLAKLSPEEMAEYQTARRILADTAYRVQTIKREINQLTQEIGRAEDVILTRVRHYQQTVGEKTRADAPENRARKRRNLPTFGAPTDLGGLAGEGREARRRRLNVATVDEDMTGSPQARPEREGSPTYAPQSPQYNTEDMTGVEDVI